MDTGERMDAVRKERKEQKERGEQRDSSRRVGGRRRSGTGVITRTSLSVNSGLDSGRVQPPYPENESVHGLSVPDTGPAPPRAPRSGPAVPVPRRWYGRKGARPSGGDHRNRATTPHVVSEIRWIRVEDFAMPAPVRYPLDCGGVRRGRGRTAAPPGRGNRSAPLLPSPATGWIATPTPPFRHCRSRCVHLACDGRRARRRSR